jgi:hypothetical protein
VLTAHKALLVLKVPRVLTEHEVLMVLKVLKV